MTKKTPTELATQVSTLFPDNNTGDITPFDLRSHLLDVNDSVTNVGNIAVNSFVKMSADGLTFEDSAMSESGGVITSTAPITAPNLRTIGWVDYNDAATTVTPIAFTAGVEAKLTNDTLGAFTNTAYLPDGVTSIWNPTTNQYDWSQLSNGDMIEIRFDGEVTTTAVNQTIDVLLYLAIGGATYSVPFIAGQQFKTAGTYRLIRWLGIYLGDNNTSQNPAEFRIVSDGNGSIKVNGQYNKITKA